MTKIPRALWKQPIQHIEPQSTAFAAAQKMFEKKVSALAVMDEGKFIGVVLERDILNKTVVFERPPKQTLVWEVMTKEPIVASLRHSIDDVLRLMTDHQVQHVPLLGEEQLPISTLSFRDLFEHRLHVAEAEKRFLLECALREDQPLLFGGKTGPKKTYKT